MNMVNDYNMSEKTNRGRAKEEATEVKLCQVQLAHLKSLAGRADKVQFVQHISAHLSHMCSLLTAFSASFGQIFTLSHITLWGKDVLDFHLGLSLSRNAISQVSSTCKLIPPLLHTPIDKVLVRGKGKRHFLCLFFLFPLPFSLSFTPYLSFCFTHTELYPVESVSHMPSS